jgi:hypothetical protein
MHEELQNRVDSYLARVRARLRGINQESIQDIVEELRSHILDKLGDAEVNTSTVDAALAALGAPDYLARQYLNQESLAQAELSRSPFRILRSFLRWASLSMAGFVVLIATIVGYCLGVLLILVAVLKPFHPLGAGLWIWRDAGGDLAMSLRLGFSNAPGPGREILGWWLVPIGLVGGGGLLILITQFAAWSARLYRSTHRLPPA